MENLEIKSGPFSVIRKGIGILSIAIAILMLILLFDTKNLIYILAALLVAFNGIYFLTNSFGLEKSWIRIRPDYLSIKWSDRIRPIRIHDSAINKICLERLKITIHLNHRNPLKLNINYFEKEQKTEIYRFFIDFAKGKNLVLEKFTSTLL
jgi:hypothetical protein